MVPMGSVRIALAQINSTLGDLAGNRKKILSFASEARDNGAEIVVFPELSLCGYPPEDLLLKPHFLQENGRVLEELTASLPPAVTVVGYPGRREGRNHNSAAVLSGGRVRATYDKMLLPNYGVFDEKRYFEPGRKPLYVEYRSVLFGITICEDIWEAEGPCAVYAEGGVQVVINLSASPYQRGKASVREELLRKRAKEGKAYFLYTNLVGGQDELVFDGGSLIVSPEGDVLARGKQFAEELVLFDLPAADSKTKPSCPIIRLEPLSEETRKPSLPPRESARLSPVEEVYSALVLGLGDYANKNGFSKVILGLSGGIDSALTACIAVDALGADRVEALTMPSAFSSEETQSDARVLAQNLGIGLRSVPIRTVYEAYLEELRPFFEDREPDVAEENIQARIRGNLLMAFSNKFGHLVLTTGNKSETSVGYCTLYGDTAGGFAVLKDVYKTLVYELARFVNEKAGTDVIPQSVLRRPPTAELKADQKDEDTLPPYDLLDRILDAYIEQDKSAPDIISEGFEPSLVYRVIGMVDRNEYKRRQAPPGIKITPKAFGKDRRMPITNKFRSH
jgi:NAD+ synthase (glutamine-hydrolysing)